MAGFELLQRRSKYNQALEEALADLTGRFRSIPEVVKVILFGSYAAGRRDLFTDLDIIVVIDSDQGSVHRTAQLYQKLESKVYLDLLVYTPEEFERKRDDPFLRHAMNNGKVIYEKKPA